MRPAQGCPVANVRGDLSHLLAEDSGRVGIVQQSPRVSFERLAAFPE
jgi:hypothetical protein